MRPFFYAFLTVTLPLFAAQTCKEEPLNHNPSIEQKKTTAHFTPPTRWQFTTVDHLPKSISLIALGPKEKGLPTSIYLATEKYSGTMKAYLKKAKQIAQSHGGMWRNLGTIETQGGKATLSQVDSPFAWGTNQMLHAFVLEQGTMYIITASAPKKVFASYKPLFIYAIQSFSLSPSFGKTRDSLNLFL